MRLYGSLSVATFVALATGACGSSNSSSSGGGGSPTGGPGGASATGGSTPGGLAGSAIVRPYLASSILAIAVSAFLLYQNVILNRLFLGINVYFISGTLGLIVHWSWINHLYGVLQASGMLIWIFH